MTVRLESRRRVAVFSAAAAVCVVALAGVLVRGPLFHGGSPATAVARRTAQLSCPAAAYSITGTRKSDPDRLVPAGADRALLCYYPSGAVPSSRQTRTTEVQPLVAALDAPRATISGTWSCPDGTGPLVVVLFGYPDGTQSYVRGSLQGCQFQSNGERIVYPSQPSIQLLKQMLGVVA